MFVAFYLETMTPSTLTSSQQLELRQIVTVILCKSKSFVSRKRIGIGLMFVDGRPTGEAWCTATVPVTKLHVQATPWH